MEYDARMAGRAKGTSLARFPDMNTLGGPCQSTHFPPPGMFASRLAWRAAQCRRQPSDAA